MQFPNTCKTSLGTFATVVLLLMSQPYVVHSQGIGISHDDYMKAIGWEDDHIVMKNILRGGLMDRIKDKPEAYYRDNAAFFSMVLLLSGVRPEHYYRLEQNGVDVINGITANVRPFDEQSLLSDLAIIGEVVEVIPETLEEDGFDVSVRIQIKEELKGSATGNTIVIRQRRSDRLPASDTRPEVGESYLLLLSSGMYGYHKANYQFREKSEIVVSPPQFGEEEVFVIYRIYPFVNGQLQRSHQNKTAVFRSLRMVHSILRQ